MEKRLEFEMLNGVKLYSSKMFIKYLNLIADTFVSRSYDLFYEPCILWINNKNKWQIDGTVWKYLPVNTSYATL